MDAGTVFVKKEKQSYFYSSQLVKYPPLVGSMKNFTSSKTEIGEYHCMILSHFIKRCFKLNPGFSNEFNNLLSVAALNM